jgi:hypothetical protein
MHLKDKKIMKKSFAIATMFLLAILSACTKTNPPGGTATEVMANEWWVTVYADGQDLLGGHIKISTYNISDSKDSIWIDDLENFWQFKCKAGVDYKALTFSTSNAQNDYYDSKVDIANGKILLNAGKSKTGNVADSIYFEAKFNDDPDNKTYIISGTARTMFGEDDY